MVSPRDISRRTLHRNFNRKVHGRTRSEVMRKTCLPLAQCVALVLWILSSGNMEAQSTRTGSSKSQTSPAVLSCTTEAQCPSGQRCGFTGRNRKGKCVVPSHDGHCLDPGGRCGCDGRPVDIFCAVGSRMEYTSAPACFVGPCPITCTEESGCGKTDLVCQKGVCVKP